MVSLLEGLKRVLVGGLSSRLRRGALGIGVDLGSTLTKFVVLQRAGTHYTLKNWGVEPVVSHPLEMEGLGVRSNFIDWNNLHASWSKHRSPPSSLGVSVSGPRVMIKSLEFPGMSEDEIREHVKWELDRYISPEMGNVLWDLHLSTSFPSDPSLKTQVLLVVAQKEWIEAIMSDFKGHGQEIDFVDVDAFALANMVTMNYGNEEAWLLIHLGPSGMLQVLMHKGQVICLREVPFAVEWYGDLVDQIRAAQKQSSGEPTMEPSVQILLDPFLEEMTGHIQDTLREYSSSIAFRSLAGVVLSGGYAVVEGMDKKISQNLGLSVCVADPFKKIQVPVDIGRDPNFITSMPLLGVAVGVALRGEMEG